MIFRGGEKGTVEVLGVVILAMMLILSVVFYNVAQTKIEQETASAALEPLKADHQIQNIQDSLGANLYSQSLRAAQEIGEKGGEPEEITPIILENLEKLMEKQEKTMEKNDIEVNYEYSLELVKKTYNRSKESLKEVSIADPLLEGLIHAKDPQEYAKKHKIYFKEGKIRCSMQKDLVPEEAEIQETHGKQAVVLLPIESLEKLIPKNKVSEDEWLESEEIPSLSTSQQKIRPERLEAGESQGYAGGILARAEIDAAVMTERAGASDHVYVDRFIPARFYTLYEMTPTYQEKKKDSPINYVKSKLIAEQPTDEEKVKEMINNSLIDWAEKETVITYAENHVDVKLIPVEVKVTEVKKTEPSFKVTGKSVEYVEPKYIVKAAVKYKLYLIDRNFKAVPTGKGESPYYQNLRYLVRQTGEEAEVSERGILGEIWEMRIEIETKAKGVKEPSLEELEKIKQGLLSYGKYRTSLEGQILTWDQAKQKASEGDSLAAAVAARLAATSRSSWVVRDYGAGVYGYVKDDHLKNIVADRGGKARVYTFTSSGYSARTESWGASAPSRAVVTAGYKGSGRGIKRTK